MQIAVGGFCTALPGKSHYKAILQTWAQTSCGVATSDWSSSLKTSSLHSSDTGGSTGNVLIKHSGEPSAEAYAAHVLYVSHRNKAGFRWVFEVVQPMGWISPLSQYKKTTQLASATAACKLWRSIESPATGLTQVSVSFVRRLDCVMAVFETAAGKISREKTSWKNTKF